MTVHKTILGDSTFYINKTKEGLYNYNRVNEKINKRELSELKTKEVAHILSVFEDKE